MSAVSHPIVVIEWLDSHTDEGWESIETVRRVCAEKNALRMVSLGYLIADEPDYVVLVGTVSPPVEGEKELVNNVMQIPRVAIVEQQALVPRPALERVPA